MITGDGYTTEPTHLRLIGDDGQWFVDGADAEGCYTAQCWTYDTWEEAWGDLADFVSTAEKQDGVTFKWRKREED